MSQSGMKIYRLTIKQKTESSHFGTSLLRDALTASGRDEYYASKEKAEARGKEIYGKVMELTGLIPEISYDIKEIEVIE